MGHHDQPVLEQNGAPRVPGLKLNTTSQMGRCGQMGHEGGFLLRWEPRVQAPAEERMTGLPAVGMLVAAVFILLSVDLCLLFAAWRSDLRPLAQRLRGNFS
jgi:hypothetical protein